MDLNDNLSPIASDRLKDGEDVFAYNEDAMYTDTTSNLPPHTTAECDYDINPTELYQAIESKQWEHAMRLLKTDSMPDPTSPALNDPASQSGIDQAKVWVVRKERDGKLRWRMMPIHASIIFKAPYGVVQAILSVAPITAQFKDDQGMLPLHLAFRNDATDDVIDELLAAYPNSIEVKDRKGRVPILCGASRASSNRWKLLHTYSQLAVSCEKKRMGIRAKTDLDKEMDLERQVQEEAMRLLKQQNELKLCEADEMIETVAGELKRIRSMSEALTRGKNEKTIQETSLEHQLAELLKEKKIFEEQILSVKDADTNAQKDLSSEVLVQYNAFIDNEKQLKEELKVIQAQKNVGASIPDELLLEDNEIISHSNISEKVKQLGNVLQDTEQKLREEVGARAHIQQKLEDTIDKQLVLTEELVTLKSDLEQAVDENRELRSHIEMTRDQVNEFDNMKASYERRVGELVEGLKSVTSRLDLLVASSMKQKTEVEAAFAVRERMLQAIARQEADMIKAATEHDEMTDIARQIKLDVESLIIQRSPLIGLTNSTDSIDIGVNSTFQSTLPTL